MDFEGKTPDQIEKALLKLKVGDRIKFRAVTRSGAPAVWRKVNGFWFGTNEPTVRYHGWPNFVVKLNEILETEKKDEN